MYDVALTRQVSVPTPQMLGVAQPVTVIRGEQTFPILVTAAQRLTEAMPHAELVIVPESVMHLPICRNGAGRAPARELSGIAASREDVAAARGRGPTARSTEAVEEPVEQHAGEAPDEVMTGVIRGKVAGATVLLTVAADHVTRGGRGSAGPRRGSGRRRRTRRRRRRARADGCRHHPRTGVTRCSE